MVARNALNLEQCCGAVKFVLWIFAPRIFVFFLEGFGKTYPGVHEE